MICSYGTPREACIARHVVQTEAGAIRYLCTKHLDRFLDSVDRAHETPFVNVEPRRLLINHFRQDAPNLDDLAAR